MNTTVRSEGDGVPPPLQDWFNRIEGMLTRFDPESPLSRLNRCQERWVVVPGALFQAIRAALAAAYLTGGAYDPTILPALEAAGYSRSFEQGPGRVADPPVPIGRWRDVKLEPTVRAVWLPAGLRLDLGGIGKGLAVDDAMRRLRRRPRLLVNAGGDLAVRSSSGDRAVLVEVEDPFYPDRILYTFGLHRGAAATSSTMRRRWGEGLHHIINPSTGRPAQTGLVSVTVVAPTAAHADVLAKAVLVLGAERGLGLLAAQGCYGLLVTAGAAVVLSPGLEEFCRETA